MLKIGLTIVLSLILLGCGATCPAQKDQLILKVDKSLLEKPQALSKLSP